MGSGRIDTHVVGAVDCRDRSGARGSQEAPRVLPSTSQPCSVPWGSKEVDGVSRPRRPIDVLLSLMIPLALVAITIAIAPVLAMTLVEHRLDVRPVDVSDRAAGLRDTGRTPSPRFDRSDPS